MKLVRETLADEPRSLRVVAGYDDISLHTGNRFIDLAAEREAEKRPDIDHVAVENSPNGERVQHRATLMSRTTSRVVYYGVWPDEDGRYRLPEGCVDPWA